MHVRTDRAERRGRRPHETDEHHDPRHDGDNLHEGQQATPPRRRGRAAAGRFAGQDRLIGRRHRERSSRGARSLWSVSDRAHGTPGEYTRVAPCALAGHHCRVRILIVSTAFPRYQDDPTAKWLVETIRRLASEGYEFEVLTSAYRGGGNTEYAGIPVHRFRYFFARWENLTHEESAPDRMQRSLLYKGMALVIRRIRHDRGVAARPARAVRHRARPLAGPARDLRLGRARRQRAHRSRSSRTSTPWSSAGCDTRCGCCAAFCAARSHPRIASSRYRTARPPRCVRSRPCRSR